MTFCCAELVRSSAALFSESFNRPLHLHQAGVLAPCYKLSHWHQK